MTEDSYFSNLAELLNTSDLSISLLAKEIVAHIRNDKSIWIMGNGGSASTAEHFETDLSFVRRGNDFPQIKAFALSSNSALITAIANDIGFEHIFSHQLIRKASRGDICIFISASGSSPNLLQAMNVCQELGIISVGILGFDGGELAKRVDHLVHVKTENGKYGPVEDVHLAICHQLSALISKDLTTKEGH